MTRRRRRKKWKRSRLANLWCLVYDEVKCSNYVKLHGQALARVSSRTASPRGSVCSFFGQKEPGLLDDLFVERPEVKLVLDSGSNRRGWTWRINLGYSYTVPGISLWSLSSGPSLIWRSLRTSFFTGTGQDSTWVTDMIWSCLYNFANCTEAKCGHRMS